MQTFNVDSHCQRNILLADRAEKRREVDDPVNAMGHNRLLESLEVQDVGEDVRTSVGDLLARFDDVGKNYVLLAVL